MANSKVPTGNTPYPGKMLTYPDQPKNAGPAWVHDCVMGCPGMPKRPSMMPGDNKRSQSSGGMPPIGLQPQFPGKHICNTIPMITEVDKEL